MTARRILVAIAATVLLCSACAGVNFYRLKESAEAGQQVASKNGTTAPPAGPNEVEQPKKLEKETIGYPLYAPKPHLLVTRTGSKDKPVEVSVIYLPDKSREGTTYAEFKPGFFGTSNLTMALTNGQLTSFGQQTDTKLPELLGGISGMITAQAGADKLGAEALSLLGASDKETGQVSLMSLGTSGYSKLGGIAKTVAGDILNYLADQKKSDPSRGLFTSELETLSKIVVKLATAGEALEKETAPSGAAAHIMTLREQADLLSKFSKATAISNERNLTLTAIELWTNQLRAALAEAVPALPKSDFELWEVLEGGKLRQVM